MLQAGHAAPAQVYNRLEDANNKRRIMWFVLQHVVKGKLVQQEPFTAAAEEYNFVIKQGREASGCSCI